MVIADDDRVDGRYLEVHQGDPLAARAAGAGGRRPAARRGAAARDQAHRAHGRPVREHRQADPAVRPRAAGARGDPRRASLRMGALRALGGRPGQARAFAERDVALAEDLVRQDREINRLNREIFRARDRDRRRPRHARVGDAHDRWSRARSSASATTPSTSASRSRSSSPGCSASSRTPRDAGDATAPAPARPGSARAARLPACERAVTSVTRVHPLGRRAPSV